MMTMQVLGDWVANPERLPNGIKGLSERIENDGN